MDFKFPDALMLTTPMSYLDMLQLERNAAKVVVTDSGGVQKEAFFYKVPCVTLRTETEWTELVELGWNRICPPTDDSAISNSILAALGSKGQAAEPYGNGTASERIVRHLCGTTGSLAE